VGREKKAFTVKRAFGLKSGSQTAIAAFNDRLVFSSATLLFAALQRTYASSK
jgi:hypothetical protein